VFALKKERDALKRAAASAAASSGAAADGPDARRLEAELKKKDELVTQVRGHMLRRVLQSFHNLFNHSISQCEQQCELLVGSAFSLTISF
jgi:hypothetical protein